MTEVVKMGSAAVLLKGARALGLTNRELADALKCSRRTVQRWIGEETSIGPIAMTDLAKLVFPKDPAVAAEIADSIGFTLESLGLVRPAPPPRPAAAPPLSPPPPPPPPPPPLPPAQMANAVVCAAAEAMDLSPRELRPALYAAFKCARELRLSVEAVEQGLSPRADASPRSPRKSK